MDHEHAPSRTQRWTRETSLDHPVKVAAAVRHRTAGATNRAIGKELGVSHQTIARWLEAADKAADAAALAPVIAAVTD